MSAVSKLEIINLALGYLKQRKIAAVDESSAQAVEAARCYNTSLKDALRTANCSFSRVTLPLALNADYMAFATWTAGTVYAVGNLVQNGTDHWRCITAHTAGTTFDDTNWVEASTLYAGQWLYAYTYPSNCLAIKAIFNDQTKDKTIGEEFEKVHDSVNGASVLLTNCPNAYARYTFDITDTTLFDSSFVIAFAHRLASDMAPGLTGDDSIADSELKKSLVAISEAERMDSYEKKDDSARRQTSPYEDVR